MPKKKSNTTDSEDRHQLKTIVELLQFALTLDDEEIVKSTVESVIELLQEQIDK